MILLPQPKRRQLAGQWCFQQPRLLPGIAEGSADRPDCTDDTRSQKSSTPIGVYLGLFPILSIPFVFSLFSGYINNDLKEYLLPWYAFLRDHGFLGLATGFSNYTPPYLYLLWAGTLVGGELDPPTIIRGISAVFNVAASILVFFFARSSGRSPRQALVAGIGFLFLPEMVVNSLVWGQCDIIYATCLMACVWCIIERKQWASLTWLGVAFAFKLQTVFIGPFILYALRGRQLQWHQLFVIPVSYCILMLPAALAGRPWSELLTIYVDQFDYFPVLSMSAPNPYLLVRAIFSDTPTVYAVGTRVGLLVGFATAIGLVQTFLRLTAQPRRERLLLMATLSLSAMPYVLPKMHERYFFPASAMAFLLAIVSPRTWPIVVLIQIADLCASARFLHAATSYVWLGLGTLLMTLALGLMIWHLFSGNVAVAPTAQAMSAANNCPP